jgi:predicted metal-dependent hydrolase
MIADAPTESSPQITINLPRCVGDREIGPCGEWGPAGYVPDVGAFPLVPNPRHSLTASVRKPVVEVRRSPRRRRTVSAYRDGERVVVLIPAQFSGAEEREWVDRMVARLAARERRGHTDEALAERARRLAERYLAEHPEAAEPASVRWVRNQNGRWGSCTPSDRSIRISERIQTFPDWVVDYVILHELAHLIVANHNPHFWALVARYPKAERARGYLEGISAAAGLGITED